MSDYIKREDAVNTICYICGEGLCAFPDFCALRAAMKMIHAADVVERPHWNLLEVDGNEYSPLIASGVYVKGMEMPKDCSMCKFAYWDHSDNFCGCDITPGKRYALLMDKAYAESSTRPEWCPLVAVSEPPKEDANYV